MARFYVVLLSDLRAARELAPLPVRRCLHSAHGELRAGRKAVIFQSYFSSRRTHSLPILPHAISKERFSSRRKQQQVVGWFLSARTKMLRGKQKPSPDPKAGVSLAGGNEDYLEEEEGSNGP